jgi:hypothetical protein
VAIEEIFDIVFVYQRPARSLLRARASVLFPLKASPFITINRMGMRLLLNVLPYLLV